MAKILISNPSSTYITFLPYIHGVLKVFAQRDPQISQHYEWLRPIYLYDTPENLIAEYDLSEIDVLGISCYVWNFSLQCEIAKRVKQINPECLVVAGGPEPDWNDECFFEQYPFIDIVVTHDGEIPFQKILCERMKCSSADYSQIPGIITKLEGKWSRRTGVEKVKSWDDTSPYCDDPQMIEILKLHPKDKSLAVIWETNRGCPYSCVFCDWGSNVSTKIRAFSNNKLMKEIKWFSQNKIERVYIADANFGILPRDEVIVDEICKQKSESNWPKIVDWCAAKNNIDRVTSICLKLHESNLNRGVLIGYQSTSTEVLSAMLRLNMAEQQHREMVLRLKSSNVHVFAAIILGSPEDTCESFKKTIHDLLDLGFHDSIRCYLYALLPNAPANEKSYLKKYKIKTKRSKIVGPVSDNTELDSIYYPRIDYIVGHHKMSTYEWIENCQYYAFISGLHNLGLTRHLANFSKVKLGISYGDFYSKIFNYFIHNKNTHLGKILENLKAHLNSFLTDEEAIFFARKDEENALYEHEKWIFIEILEQKSRFYSELEICLIKELEFPEVYRELIDFQSFSIFPICGDYQQTAKFELNWLDILDFSGDASAHNRFQKESHFIISHKIDFTEKYKWLNLQDMTKRKSRYVQEVLGSMIYKNSSALAKLDSLGIDLEDNRNFNDREI